MKNKKKTLFLIAFMFLLGALVMGATYAIIEFTKVSGENSVTTGRIKMSYTEPSNALILSGALPKTDDEGKAQSDYFEFKVSSSATTNSDDDIGVKIPYEVNISSIEIDSDKTQLLESEVKVYLTKVVNNAEEEITIPKLISQLDKSDLLTEGTKVYGQTDVHKNGSDEIITTYRLRAWIDEDVDLNNISNKQYKFRVDINANAKAKVASVPEIKATQTLLKTWTSKAKNATSYKILITSNKKAMPDTYTYNGVEYTKQQEIDVSSASDGGVIIGEYKDADNNLLGIMGADGGILAPEDSSMLIPLMSATDIDLKYLNTSNVTNMNMMFMCNNLETLDLSNFNTSNVTNMQGMFNGCPNLISLDLSNFNTSNVTNMSLMFRLCEKLESLNLKSFDTSNVTNMNMMFGGCKKLTSLDLSSFNTLNVTIMSGMFENCTSLESLNLSNFNTSNVIDMQAMFYNCSNLASIDVTKFDTLNVTNMASMFNQCKSLTELDLSNFNTSKVTNMSSMFSNDVKLTSVIVGCNWQTATTATNMFNGAGVSEVTKVCN